MINGQARVRGEEGNLCGSAERGQRGRQFRRTITRETRRDKADRKVAVTSVVFVDACSDMRTCILMGGGGGGGEKKS